MKCHLPNHSTSSVSGERLLLIDVSNSFSKIAIVQNGVIGSIQKIPTPLLAERLKKKLPNADRAVISSVVPKANQSLGKLLPCPILWLDHKTAGVDIRYPKPGKIGADRLANVAAAVSLGRLPAIVVDFGTAVTFDIIDPKGCYLGGIIAPGLATAASALHERTALLPLTKIQRIESVVGKSTRQGIQIGLLLGVVGIVREVVTRITRVTFDGKKPFVLTTGGDAELVDRLSRSGGGKKIIDLVDPLLTLKGLLVIAGKI
ncbi:MAG: type III pantothenate kinase [bacterium]